MCNRYKNMKYKKSPLDRFLEQRINDNAKELKQTLNETLGMQNPIYVTFRNVTRKGR